MIVGKTPGPKFTDLLKQNIGFYFILFYEFGEE